MKVIYILWESLLIKKRLHLIKV